MKGKLTRTIFAIAMVAVAFAGVAVFRAQATPPSGQTSTTLARGTDESAGTIVFQGGTDVVMAQVTIAPGGSSGWHSHPGGAIVVVKQGSITAYRAIGSQCQSETYGGGQAFIERPGEVGDVLNTGTILYVAYVTFPRVPQGAPSRTDEPNPGTCPGI